MGKVKESPPKQRSQRRSKPARTPKARENQLINLAVDLAERQLRDGTATSQVITHFLKLATVREQYEVEKLRADLKLSEAKAKAIEAQENKGTLYEKAIEAFKSYSGFSSDEEDDCDD